MGSHQGQEALCRPLPRVSPTTSLLHIDLIESHRYYEWLTKGKDKLPHLTKRKDGAVLFMAGLYDCAIIEGTSSPPSYANNLNSPSGKPLWTFTIVTTEANENFSWLHERQPVFLTTREEIDRWLDTSSGVWDAELTKMVRPYSGTAELEW